MESLSFAYNSLDVIPKTIWRISFVRQFIYIYIYIYKTWHEVVFYYINSINNKKLSSQKKKKRKKKKI